MVIIVFQTPEKKPLIRPDVPKGDHAKVLRGSQKGAASPLKCLSEFENPEFKTI